MDTGMTPHGMRHNLWHTHGQSWARFNLTGMAGLKNELGGTARSTEINGLGWHNMIHFTPITETFNMSIPI